MQHITCICDSLDLIVVLRCSRRMHHGHRSQVPTVQFKYARKMVFPKVVSNSRLLRTIFTDHGWTHSLRGEECGREGIMQFSWKPDFRSCCCSMAICLPTNEIESFELDVTIEGPWQCRTTANPFRPHEAYLLWVFIFNFLFRFYGTRRSLTYVCALLFE